MEESQEDTWEMLNNNIFARHHNAPRRHLFIPTREDCPLPLEWLDVMRLTQTNINHEKYIKIEDYWTTDLRDGRIALPMLILHLAP